MSKKQKAISIPGLTGSDRQSADFLQQFLLPRAIDPIRGRAEGVSGATGLGELREGLSLPGGQNAVQDLGVSGSVRSFPIISDLFGEGSRQRASTLRGENLNFLETPTGRALSESLGRQGSDMFTDLLDRINQRAAAGGNLRSSARTRAIAEGAEDVTENVTDALTQAAAQQFAQERAAQESAAGSALSQLPQLAQLLFQQGGQQRELDRGEAVQEIQLAESLRRAPIQDLIQLLTAGRSAGGGITQGRDPLALGAGLAGSIFKGAAGLPF